MNKAALRTLYKQKRLALAGALGEKNKLDDLLLIQFQRLVIDMPTSIMTYSPIEKWGEFAPHLITDYCYFKEPNQTLIYPVVGINDGNNSMSAVIVDEETLFTTNSLGIDEPINGEPVSPADIDCVLVPLLCFDLQGNRVGYGKGYYDRFLKLCSTNCIKIGFSYFEPVDAIEDCDKNDVKLDYCITPGCIFAFQ